MSHAPRPPSDEDVLGRPPQLEIVIPVYNEAQQLAASITALRSFLDSRFPLTTVVTVVDNASSDDTWSIASGLAASLPGVEALHLDQKGRGRALRAAWTASRSPVVAYMDADLATGLEALLPLVAPLLTGHSDVAIGTRLAPGAHVVRGARREIISRGYNVLLKTALANSCSDAQCGFKALRREAADVVLPLVDDEAWFFDTEVLITAQRLGLRIHEVPVDWVDDLDSRVAVARTAWLDVCGVARMMTPASRRRAARARRDLPRTLVPASSATGSGPDPRAAATGRARSTNEVFADELLRFAGVGLVSTLAYVLLFAVLEPWIDVYAANAVAIIGCSLGNTAAHRGMSGTARLGLDRRHRMLVGSALLGVSLGSTTLALFITRAFGLDALAPELLAVTAANVAAAAFRFAILRTWIFRPRFGTHLGPAAPADQVTGATNPPDFIPEPLAPLSATDLTPARTSR
ncbi:MAG TPA: dolichyl-phosphate beta-glucosyltransferase [Acidimicrobiales bacterium]